MDSKALKREMSLRFKQMREALEYSQEKMAAHLGVVRPSYTKYESGFALPSLPTLRVLAASFDVSLDWLVANKGPMFFNEKAVPEKKSDLENVMDDVKELLESMERIPLLRYEVLSFFQKFKLEYKELVESSEKEIKTGE
ncbi:MAG: helix-turn-helix domain-containing protein [Candidatus Aminicenantes bacterium]|nr:helix-turn-helix domain-containing protein [Candidatus Aminicenantes bacterium]NIM78320.1 helix-turn-helix domain-containing protein [Candidatus Aminicenantes bacterium]NIN17551.1 helix-turn-helix domain-containing protein [Candidatus Aminicenantes bacterium]NIN41437.1 helix-turn-helix domain-containing protein [Candidatus Aminicenantes bacterium]NIN84203.1 helix-turn-helix domain-containing protein [Candidatus Aminicenantes bacterium]